jgi:DNA polymerase III delta prime subunit
MEDHWDLLEREHEVGRVRAALEDLLKQRAAPLVISGPPGIGKTQVLDLATALAGELGVTLSRARGHELEGSLLAPSPARASGSRRRQNRSGPFTGARRDGAVSPRRCGRHHRIRTISRRAASLIRPPPPRREAAWAGASLAASEKTSATSRILVDVDRPSCWAGWPGGRTREGAGPNGSERAQGEELLTSGLTDDRPEASFPVRVTAA